MCIARIRYTTRGVVDRYNNIKMRSVKINVQPTAWYDDRVCSGYFLRIRIRV